jgi:acetoacetyl-CoA synthetase
VDADGQLLQAIVTNSINAVAIALAVASIGGVFSSTATDMGAQVRFIRTIVMIC